MATATGTLTARTLGLVGVAAGGACKDAWRAAAGTCELTESELYPGAGATPSLSDAAADAFLYATRTDGDLGQMARGAEVARATDSEGRGLSVALSVPGRAAAGAGDIAVTLFDAEADAEFAYEGIAVRNLTDEPLSGVTVSLVLTDPVTGATYELSFEVGEVAGYLARFDAGGPATGAIEPVRLRSVSDELELPDGSAYAWDGHGFDHWEADHPVTLGGVELAAGTPLAAGESVALVADTTFTAVWVTGRYVLVLSSAYSTMVCPGRAFGVSLMSEPPRRKVRGRWQPLPSYRLARGERGPRGRP